MKTKKKKLKEKRNKYTVTVLPYVQEHQWEKMTIDIKKKRKIA